MDLVGSGEIADLLGVSRQRVHQLAEQPDFPKPIGTISRRRMWNRADIERWAAANDRFLIDGD